MDNQEKQTNKYLPTQCNQKQQKTLDLSKEIISGTANLAFIEIGLTIKETFENSSLRSTFKNENGQIGFSVVKILVERFIDSFGFSTKMNGNQIETLTVDTLEKFSFETLQDIILFFKMARNGNFGATNRGVDSNLIYGEWYPKYLDIKAIEREKIIEKEHSEFKNNTLSIEDVKKSYEKSKAKKEFFLDKVIEYVEKITEGINREQLEVLISEWMDDPIKKPYVYHLNKKRKTIK